MVLKRAGAIALLLGAGIAGCRIFSRAGGGVAGFSHRVHTEKELTCDACHYEYATGEDYSLVLTANGKWTGRAPQVADEGPVRLAGTFQCVESGSTPDIKLELINEVSSIPS